MNEQFLTATPKRNPSGAIEWTLSDGTKSGGHGHFPSVALPKKSGAHHFTISIGPDRLGIEFSKDPLWIHEGSTCPTQSGIDSAQIKGFKRLNDTQIFFTDLNKGDAVDLWYQLNFVDSDGKPVNPLDPEIKNGGGTGNLYAAVFVLAAAAALAYVAYFAFYK